MVPGVCTVLTCKLGGFGRAQRTRESELQNYRHRGQVNGVPGSRNQNLADNSGNSLFEYAAGCSVIFSLNFKMVD